jgi:predicted metal-dependent RNase
MEQEQFKQIKDYIEKFLAKKRINVSKIEAEGPEIGIYTDTPLVFFDEKSMTPSIPATSTKAL